MSEKNTEENVVMTFNDKRFSLDIQKGFIRTLIYDDEWAMANGFRLLQADYFEDITLYNIFSILKDYYKTYKAIPSLQILKNNIQKFLEKRNLKTSDYFRYEDALNDIYDVTDEKQLKWYEDQLVTFMRQCEWKKILNKGDKVLEVGNYEEAISQFEKVLSINSDTDLGVDVGELSDDKLVEMIENNYNTKNMLKTNIPSWDEALGGGFTTDNIHLVCAPPGSGKTRLMTYLAMEALKQHKNVIFITLELTQEQLTPLFISNISGYQMQAVTSDKEILKEYLECKNKFFSEHDKHLLVKYYPQGKINTDVLNAYILNATRKRSEKYNEKWQPDVIFIDYLDKMVSTQKLKGNTYEDIGAVAADCKNLATKFKCPVISASQLGRYSWNVKGDEVVTMAAIADSAQKAHLAHSVTTINANVGEKAQHKCRLYMAKSRTGTYGAVIYCNQNLGTCRLEETEQWDPVKMEQECSSNVTLKSAPVTER